ncbi:insulinase family protein [Kitasatospora sp. NPDC088783]|uniref:insulinase family protein n=1 Tax=Kitasatospora sp. NPDC088783 TaxID=3364077 RepID=UPI003830C961
MNTLPWQEQPPRTGGLLVVRVPARPGGYEVARVVWHTAPGTGTDGGPALVALEALLHSVALPGRTVADMLESLGVSVEPGRTHVSCHLEFQGSKDGIRKAVPLFADALAATVLQPDAVRTARASVLGLVERLDSSLPDRAERAFYAAVAGADGLLARHGEGTVESLLGMTPEQVTGAREDLVRSLPVSLFLSDAAAEPAWRAALARTAPATPVVAAGPTLVPAPARQRVDVSVTGPRGAHLLWGCMAELGDVMDHVALEIAAHALGGGWSARWQHLFREELGRVYGTHARIRSLGLDGRAHGAALIGMSTGAADADSAAALLEEEAARFSLHGLTEKEVTDGAGQLLRAEGLFQVSAQKFVARAAQPVQAGLGVSFAARRLECLASATPDEVNLRLRRLEGRAAVSVARSKGGH